MIDWLSLVLDFERLPEDLVFRLLDWRDTHHKRVLCLDPYQIGEDRDLCQLVMPGTGEIRTYGLEWATWGRESVRSDSHQVVVRVGGRLEITGSPARSMGLSDNVFGSGDIVECARAHIAAASAALGIALPDDLALWRCIRVDVTHNYDMGSAEGVRAALGQLRLINSGRYRMRSVHAAETIYFGSPRMRSGKIYHKGPHLRRQADRGEAQATVQQIDYADRLLRLEMKLGGEWMRRHGQKWWEFAPETLDIEHGNYFGGLIGSCEVIEMGDILGALRVVAPSEGQALAAHRTWCVIQSMGLENAISAMPRATWYRHKKLLMAAGLSWADLCSGNVVPLRRRPLILEHPVTSWAELLAA